MKKLYYLSLLLGITFGSLAFVACGGDDDDDPAPVNNGGGGGEQTTETDIAGTWKISLTTNAKTGQGNQVTRKYDETISFNSDNTFMAIVESDGYGDKAEGTWSRLGNDRVVVDITKWYNINQGNVVENNTFAACKDTLSYFFKGNAVFCESVINNGYFAYTRSGELPFNGYGDYANSPILGVWVGEDYAWDDTPITLRFELRGNGTYAMTMDNHLGWSEGMAGYYILDGNRVMFISYYFTSKMNSDDNTWEVVGYRMRGGHWIDFKNDGVKLLLSEDPGSMSGKVEFLVKEGETAGASLVGHWKSTETITGNVVEDEYWEIESDKTVRHWWIRDGKFAQGTMGTYELTQEGDNTYIVCHWTYWLADSGNNTNPKQGSETGRGEQDYTLRYVYSKISDLLLVWWNDEYQFERFKRIK
jgi:hypothetical protein